MKIRIFQNIVINKNKKIMKLSYMARRIKFNEDTKNKK